MPYEYWCAECRARSPERRERRADAEDELVQHRHAAHGGLAPAAGDGVRHVHDESRGDGCLPSGSFLFFMFLLAAVLANCWGR
ncbi:hypothetical protein H1V43_32230 [Streptomyces sp. PSKA54]|uniref:Uncharacterized protein n=1 Tax=Streptomyces himalayensis subsp. aureolus TaxID=2758039 RepID=A0A7W2HJC3_9ACTN|nr:hypothetical protein [Streptomyces himalayensis]MBA4865933.1 hypothetical protein [Streptomyces himalayensis subsp. aureolus]